MKFWTKVLCGLFLTSSSRSFSPPSCGGFSGNFGAFLRRNTRGSLFTANTPRDFFGFVPFFCRRLAVFDVAARKVDHKFGKLGGIAGTLVVAYQALIVPQREYSRTVGLEMGHIGLRFAMFVQKVIRSAGVEAREHCAAQRVRYANGYVGPTR